MHVGDYFCAHVIIDVWWSQGGPWKYKVELMTHLDSGRGFQDTSHQEGGRRMCVFDHSVWPCPSTWSKGTDLALCTFAAEDEALRMCLARGLNTPVLVPYILLKDKMKQVEAAMDRREQEWEALTKTQKLLGAGTTL